MPKETKNFENFELSGGPVYNLARSIGLMHANTGVFRTGVALGLSLWLGLLFLALAEGRADDIFSLKISAIHARLLLVIPLLFLSDGVVAPRLLGFCRSQVRNGTLRAEDLAGMNASISKLVRLHDSRVPETILFGIVVLSTVVAPGPLGVFGAEYLLPSADPNQMSVTRLWYWYVCLPIFKFVVLRWIWRYGHLVWMIWLFSRRNLFLKAAHPDRAGGIGQIMTVQQQLSPMLLAVAVFDSAILAERFSVGRVDLSVIYLNILFVVALGYIVMAGPLLMFCSLLYEGRMQGGSDFTNLGARYVSRFDDRWVNQGNGQDQDLLGSSDIQSLADLQNAHRGVQDMRTVLINNRLTTTIAWAGAGPFLPLLLFVYPAKEIVGNFFGRVLGF